MISLSHDETVAFLNLWNARNGQSAEIVNSILEKLSAHKLEWGGIIRHDEEGYSLETITRDLLSVEAPQMLQPTQLQPIQ